MAPKPNAAGKAKASSGFRDTKLQTSVKEWLETGTTVIRSWARTYHHEMVLEEIKRHHHIIDHYDDEAYPAQLRAKALKAASIKAKLEIESNRMREELTGASVEDLAEVAKTLREELLVHKDQAEAVRTAAAPSSLAGTCADLEHMRLDLLAMVSSAYEGTYNLARLELHDAKAEVAALKKDLSSRAAKEISLQEDIRQLKADRRVLQGMLSVQEHDVAQLKARNTELEQQVEKRAVEVDRLKSENQTVFSQALSTQRNFQTETEAAKRDRVRPGAEIVWLEKSLEETNRDSQQHAIFLNSEHRKNIEQFKSQVNTLATARNQALAALSSTSSKLPQSEGSNACMEERIAALVLEKDGLNERLSETSTALRQAELACGTHAASVTRLKADLNESSIRITCSAAELESLRESHKGLEEKVRRLESDAENARLEWEEKVKTQQNATQSFAEAHLKEVNGLQLQLKISGDESKALAEAKSLEIDILKHQLKTANDDSKAHTASITKLQSERMLLQQEVETKSHKITTLESEKLLLQQDVETKSHPITTLEAHQKTLQDDLNSHTRSNAKLMAEKQALADQFETSRKRIEDMGDALQRANSETQQALELAESRNEMLAENNVRHEAQLQDLRQAVQTANTIFEAFYAAAQATEQQDNSDEFNCWTTFIHNRRRDIDLSLRLGLSNSERETSEPLVEVRNLRATLDRSTHNDHEGAFLHLLIIP